MRLRSWISWVLVLAFVGVGGTTASASTATPPTPVDEWLAQLTDLAAQRVQIADKVAAAKFGTDIPIDDPVREQQILDTVAVKSVALGLDRAATVRFFRDQIEANKVVQRGLYVWWIGHPADQPSTRPDLDTEVRPVIDRLNAGLLDQLVATRPARANQACGLRLAITVYAVNRLRFLDKLHEQALAEAARSACTG